MLSLINSARDPNHISKIIGYCARCREELSPDWELWKDEEGNLFCCKECAVAYHGICEISESL